MKDVRLPLLPGKQDTKVERASANSSSALTSVDSWHCSLREARGRKPTYTAEQRMRIVQEVQRAPDRAADQTATWSLCLLCNALHKAGLSHIAKETVRLMLYKAGYRFGKTRTWCPTGIAVRKRKAGAVTVHDPKAQEKQTLIELAYEQAETAGFPLW